MFNNIENEKIKKALELYMLVNNLKHMKKNTGESVADSMYGAMILAIAIQSEYRIINNNIEYVLEMILLGKVASYSKHELLEILKSLENEDHYYNYVLDLCKYFNPEEFGSSHGKLARKCLELDELISSFFKEFNIEIKEEIKEEDIIEIYNIAKNNGITNKFGRDDTKNYEIFRFYCLNIILKKKERKGWDNKHWNIQKDKREKISDHIIGTIGLALALKISLDFKVNLDKVIHMLSIHELGEIEIGDYTPFDGVTPEVKAAIERKAFKNILGNLSGNDEMFWLFREFEENKTIEAKFAYYCDKLEADIQSKVYHDMGLHHSLDNQENNIVMQSQKVQNIIAEGAETAFDVWYEYDKPIYQDTPVFTKTLKYLKDTKLK